MTPPLTDLDILNESELTSLERSSGDDCDMAAVRCVVRELRHRRSRELSAGDVAGLRWLLHLPLPVKNEQERQHSIAVMTTIARMIGEKP